MTKVVVALSLAIAFFTVLTYATPTYALHPAVGGVGNGTHPSCASYNGVPGNASAAGNCSACSTAPGCAWCESLLACTNVSSGAWPAGNCTSGWCQGEACRYTCDAPCSKSSTYPCSEHVIGMLILIFFYGVLLAYGASLISDGSEGMLELFPAYGTVIGALLLPVLGAIPDAAIILVSGAFGSLEEAQEQISVGVGTLAGSTIMLLTVPWALSLWVAGCDFDDFGEAIDKRRSSWSLTRVGITVDEDTPTNAKIMLFTSLCYWIVQGVAFAHLKDDDGAAAKKAERPLAVAGFAVCIVLLTAYCIYQVLVPKLAQRRTDERNRRVAERNARLRALAILHQFPGFVRSSATHVTQGVRDRVDAAVLHFARRWKQRALAASRRPGTGGESEPLLVGSIQAGSALVEEDDSDEEEEDEGDAREHFGKNLAIAIFKMVFGTAIVAFFSDPMVGVISDLGAKLNIGAFYISFVVTPYCSNASELVSSLVFASRKKQANTSLTYSQIYGAASMNNTLCLGLFYALIAFRHLAWKYTAETLSIILVTWCVGLVASFKRNFALWWSIPNLVLYPLSLVFVWVIENQVGWA